MSARNTALALTLFALVFLSLNIGGYDLWAPDEPRYAQVAREMLHSGNWFTPFINGEPYLEKPPAFFWSIAAASWPFGDVSALTARVPSALAAALTVFMTYALALRLFNDRIAWWSAIILMTTSRFWWQARTAQIDMVLTALLTVSLYAFWRHVESPARRWRVLFFAVIGVALLTKGPVGILFPLLLWFAYHWWRPDARKRFPIAWGTIGASVFALLWFVPARFAVATGGAGAAIGEDFYRQVIGRAFLGISKAQPPWYYFLELPVDLVPWTLVAPWTIVWLWRNRQHDNVRLLIAWILPALVLFSLIAGKRQVYLLPLFPAFAIALAGSVIPLLDDARTRYRNIASTVWIATLVAIASIPLVIANRLPEWSTPILYVFTAIAVPAAIATAIELWRNQSRRLPALLAIPIALLMAATALTALPRLNDAKSAKAFCAPLQQLTNQHVEYRLYSFMFSREEYIFYTSHFHEPVFVDSVHGDESNLTDEFEEVLRIIGPELLATIEDVPIENHAAITPGELQALTNALDRFRESLAETNPEFSDTFARVEDAMRGFTRDFSAEGPAFMFIQSRDWPLLKGIAPDWLPNSVIREEHVGARHVFLVANAEGRNILPNAPNR